MILEAATWGGSMIGPILGGKIALEFGLRAPFACAFFLTGIAFVLLLVGYRETLGDAQRVEFTWARANPLGQLWPLIEHPVMIRFAIILGPTYLFAVVAAQNISSLCVARALPRLALVAGRTCMRIIYLCSRTDGCSLSTLANIVALSHTLSCAYVHTCVCARGPCVLLGT